MPIEMPGAPIIPLAAEQDHQLTGWPLYLFLLTPSANFQFQSHGYRPCAQQAGCSACTSKPVAAPMCRRRPNPCDSINPERVSATCFPRALTLLILPETNQNGTPIEGLDPTRRTSARGLDLGEKSRCPVPTEQEMDELPTP